MAKATYRPTTNDFLVTLDDGQTKIVKTHDEAVTLIEGKKTAEQESRNITLPAIPTSTDEAQDRLKTKTASKYVQSAATRELFRVEGNVAVPISKDELPEGVKPEFFGSSDVDFGLGLIGLKRGKSEVSKTPDEIVSEDTSVKSEADIEQLVLDMLESVVSSGNTINPNITPEDIAALDIENFIAEAEASVSAEFRQKFSNAKQDFVTFFERTDQDLSSRIASIGREKDVTQLAADESFAGRGTATSSRRLKFDKDLREEAERRGKDVRTLAFRGASDVGKSAERLLGTEALRGTEIPKIGGEAAFSLSETPQIGSLQREKQFTIESLARQSQTDEARRRALTFSNLGFA